MISPLMWDDDEFVALDDFAVRVWCYLLTGPEARESCPGLMRLGAASLAEGLRRSVGEVHQALEQLAAPGWLRVYRELRLIHIPRAPAHRGKCNGNILRGWHSRWQRLPECEPKRWHVGLMEPCRPDTGKAWESTFGAEESLSFPGYGATAGTQGSLFVVAEKPFEQSPQVSRKAFHAVDRRSPACERKAPDLDLEQDPERERERDPELRAQVHEAARLWELQEELRAELGLPPVESLFENEVVRVALQSYSPEQLEHVLRVHARKAAENPRERDWFDGRRNWAPAVIQQSLGQSAESTPEPARGGRAAGHMERARRLKEQGL